MSLGVDVVSLFTKVPVDLAVSAAHSCLVDDPTLEDSTLLSPNEISSVLSVCLSECHLLHFQRTILQADIWDSQGSPVLVAVANLVMENVEQKALNSFNVELPLWKRYIYNPFTNV